LTKKTIKNTSKQFEMRLLRGKFIFFEDKHEVLMISFVMDADSAETRQKKEEG
jgi:hypothetical protein